MRIILSSALCFFAIIHTAKADIAVKEKAIKLECRQGAAPDEKLLLNAPVLNDFKSVEFLVYLERHSSRIALADKVFDGEPSSELDVDEDTLAYAPLTEEFVLAGLKANNGKPIKLRVLTSAPYLGSQLATIRFEIEDPKALRLDETTWTFHCKNKSAGSKASFLNLCTKGLVFPSWSFNCRTDVVDPTGLPANFDFTTGDNMMDVIVSEDVLHPSINEPVAKTFESDDDERIKYIKIKQAEGRGTLDFFVNEKASPTHLEDCFFRAAKPSINGLKEFWMSRTFIHTGVGPAVVLKGDGLTRIPYICGEDSEDEE